jgi:minor extracellular protease Epr
MLLLSAVAVLIFLLLRPGQSDEVPFAMVFPGANSRDTYFTMHGIGEAQAIAKGSGIKVGILDHLFGTNLHPDLYAGGGNFLGDDALWKLEDKDEHGYWMALVLKEIAPEVEVYALNTSDRDERTRVTAMIKAIDWAIEQQLDLLTYSYSQLSPEGRELLDPAVERAHQAGIVTTFIHYGHPDNILPGSLHPGPEDGREPDVNVLHRDYSVVFVKEYAKIQRGEKSDWYRPFLSISSTSPVTAGIVAMMLSVQPDLTPAQCQEILRRTSKPLTWRDQQVPRCLDAAAAVQAVMAQETPS